MKNEFLLDFFLMFVRRLPVLLVLLVGIIYAAVRWRTHPRVSLMVSIASVIYIFEAIIFNVLIYQLPVLIRNLELSAKATNWLYTILYFVEDFVLAGIILLVVGAVFTGRNGASQTSRGAVLKSYFAPLKSREREN
jgi:hypothetical protein